MLPWPDARFEVLRTLSEGRQACTLLVKDHLGDAPVAVIKDFGDADPAVIASLNALSHGHLNLPTELLASGAEGSLWALLPYLERGASLEWLGQSDLSRTAPDARHARIRLALGAARGLARLHEADLLHRDIKPNNLLVDHQGRGVLADFGLSRPDRAQSDLVGTAGYLAPELFEGQPAGQAADLFALGVTIFELLTGRLPFGARLDSPYLQRIQRAEPFPSPLRDDPLAPLLRRLLSANPATRPSARHAAAALADALGLDAWESPQGVAARVRVSGAFGRAHIDRHIVARACPSGQSRPRLLWVVGGPGAGKTSLLAAFGARAAQEGLFATRPTPPPLKRDLSMWLGLPTATATLPLSTQVWADTERQSRLLLVDDFGAQGPVAALLATVLRTRPHGWPHRLGVVVASSEESFSAAAAYRERLAPYADIERLELHPLPRTAIRDLCRRLSPEQAPPESLVDSILERSSGHALLVSDALQGLVDAGHTPLQGAVALPARLPDAGGDLVASQATRLAQTVARLSSEARWKAQVIAWAGAPIPEAVFGRGAGVGDDLTAPQTIGDVFSGAQGDSGRVIGLRSGALRSHLRARPLPPDAPHRLAPLSQALEALGERATAGALYERAGDWAQAADCAFELGHWQVACRRYRKARAHLDGPGCLRLAEAASRAGQPEVAAAALETAFRLGIEDTQALKIARLELEAGRPRSVLRVLASERRDTAWAAALRARAHLLLGEYDTIALPETVLEAQETELWLHGAITQASLLLYRGALEDAAACVDRAIERCRRQASTPAPQELPMLLNLGGVVAQRRGALDAARQAYTESLEAASRSGAATREGIALMNLGTVAQTTGDLAPALDAYAQAEQVARRISDETALLKALLNRCNVQLQVGQEAEARAAIELGLRLEGRLQNPHLYDYLRALEAELAFRRDEHPKAIAAARDVIGRFEARGATREGADVRRLLVRSYLRARRLRDAESQLEKLGGSPVVQESGRFQLWLAVLRLRLQRDRDGEASEDTIADGEARLDRFPEVREDVRWRLHWALLRAGSGDDARRRHAERLTGLLNETADRLPARLRASYLGQREVREALRDARSRPPTADRAGVRAGLLSRVLEINKRLARAGDVEGTLNTILDTAITLGNAERGFVLTLEPGQTHAAVRLARNFDREDVADGALKLSQSVAREVVLTGEPVVTVDAGQDERFLAQRSIQGLRLRSIVCVPMRRDGVACGALYLDNRFQRGAFDPDRLAFLEAFADQAALALRQAEALEREQATQRELAVARKALDGLRRETRSLTRALARRGQPIPRRVEAGGATAERYPSMIGRSAAMARVFDVLDRLKDIDVPVLIRGESGTGKELVARALHRHGHRASAAMVSINCAALPETLLEAELFGAVRGAYTGAVDRAGLFEEADGGTIFLDEVGETSPSMQAKLLRVLDSGEIRRVGGTRTQHVDVRVVAATNRDLTAAAKAGIFRQDLLFRLDVVRLELPPLRERVEDIPALATFLLARAGVKKGLGRAAAERLRSYDWPGNVRELEGVLLSAAILGEGEALMPEDLAIAPSGGPREAGRLWDGQATMASVQLRVIREAVAFFGGNKSQAAKALGIDRNTLRSRLARGEKTT